jgi:hypothetical protein
MTEMIRNELDFLYPEPSTLRKFLSRLSAQVYPEGIDESFWQYSVGKKLDHKAALAGGTRFTIIRVSNGLSKDIAFDVAWKSALDDGMQNVMIYANIVGNVSGGDQADFALISARDFITSFPGKIVVWGDFEKDGLTVPVATRQKIALDFLNSIHAHYDTGIYSNVAYWGTLYGNLKPPAFAWLWGANWTSASMGVFPSSWDLSKLVVWQYAVWNTYSWSTPIAGNVPTIDNDRWVWKGGTPEDFLRVTPPDNDLEVRVSTLEQKVPVLTTEYERLSAELDAVITKVASMQTSPLLTAIYVPNEPSVAYKLGGFNKANNEIFEFYPSGSSDDVGKRIHITAPLRVFVEPVYVGDGAMKVYLIVDTDFLNKNKPTCAILVNASKGHLSV